MGPSPTSLAHRVAARFIQARQVSVMVDVKETLEARKKWPLFDEAVVGRFDAPVPLYRVFDETELKHVISSGKITGGSYSVAPERAHGASWGYNIDAVINMGNTLRGNRLGNRIYLAKIDGFDEKFLHLSPGIEFDPQGPPEQPAKMDPEKCNPGLGCSIFIKAANVEDFFKVEPNGQIQKMSLAELREEAEGLSAKETPAETPAAPPEDVRDSSWGLQPRDKFVVTKGSSKIGIGVRNYGVVKDVWQPGKDLANRDFRVNVSLAFTWPFNLYGRKQVNRVTLWAMHPNRLKDPEVALLDSSGNRILVRKR